MLSFYLFGKPKMCSAIIHFMSITNEPDLSACSASTIIITLQPISGYFTMGMCYFTLA